MRKSVKIAIATAFAGLVAAGGAAFTATGIVNSPHPDRFIGGVVSQTVHGATLQDLAYTFKDVSNTHVTAITMTFTGIEAVGQVVHLKVNSDVVDADFDGGGAAGSGAIARDTDTGTTGVVTFNSNDPNGMAGIGALEITVDDNLVPIS